MKLRITSITISDVGALINEVTTYLEDLLRPSIEMRDYGGGIEQFVVFFVSVDNDPLETERRCVANNRASRYKGMVTGKMVSFVGLAVPVEPDLVLKTPRTELRKELVSLLLSELRDPPYAMPKKFERERLLTDFEALLAGCA